MTFFLNCISPGHYYHGSVVFNGKFVGVIRPLLLLNHSLGQYMIFLTCQSLKQYNVNARNTAPPRMQEETNKNKNRKA